MMHSAGRTAVSPVTSQPRFLLLLPRGHDAPGDLVRGLERRGIRLREVHDPPSAMAALGRAGYAGLVLVEPGECYQAAQLLAAVRDYHPSVAVWQYTHGGSPRLSRCGEEPDGAALGGAQRMMRDATETEDACSSRSEPASGQSDGGHAAENVSGPAGRAAEQAGERELEDVPVERSGPDAIDEPGAAADPSEQPSAYLTEEELAMLLEETDLRREGD